MPRSDTYIKKGATKHPKSGMKKGYKAIGTYLREILQKKPINEVVKNFEHLGVPFKTYSELLAWKKMLIALGKNPHASLTAMKDIEERVDGKIATELKGKLSLDINLDELSNEELQNIIDGKV